MNEISHLGSVLALNKWKLAFPGNLLDREETGSEAFEEIGVVVYF